MYEELYCRVYTNTQLSIDDLSLTLAKYLGTTVQPSHCIDGKILDLDVSVNKEHDNNQLTDKRDGFLYYKFFVEIEPINGIKEEEYINAVGELLNFLWSNDIKAVASCQFESDLPYSGGYKGFILEPPN